MTKEIQLTQGKVARVSDHRFEYLNQWNWFAVKSKRSNSWYAARNLPSANGTRKKIFMHNEIMQPPPGMEVDHQDFDGLNNQDDNLRICTHAQNTVNRRKQSNNTSGYKGVNRLPGGRWRAQLKSNYIYVYSAVFDTAEEAARAYDEAAKLHFGEFAVLNFPE